MASNTATMGNLPSGAGICTTIPDILYLPELVRSSSCGGLMHERGTFLWGLRGSGLDPGGLYSGGAGEPSGLGHVRVRLLLRHDLHLDGGVCLWRSPQQGQLGRRRLCVPWHRCLLLPQCFSGVGQSDSGHERRDELQELPAGHLCSGVLVRGDSPLLHPHHPVGHQVEVLLNTSTCGAGTELMFTHKAEEA